MSDTFETIKVEPERDRYGRYLIHPAKGGKPKAYTRATTVAETLDDRFNLELYKIRMAMKGTVTDKSIYAQAASLPLPVRGDGNWERWKNLGQKAIDTAKEHDPAALGEALHRFTERINRGETINVPAPWDADVAAYNAALVKAGLIIDRRYLERIVVLEQYGIAGTFDNILNGRIADLKTGADLDFSWCAIAVQLAIYAHADTLYDPATKTHEPMPPVDQEKALVIHLPAGQATCTLYEVDIAAGWEAAQQALWVRGWRKRKNLAVPAIQVGGGEPSTMPAAGAATPAVDVGGGETGRLHTQLAGASPGTDVGGGESPSVPPPVEQAAPADLIRTGPPTSNTGDIKYVGNIQPMTDPYKAAALAKKRQALIDRIKALPDVEREELAHRWPLGVPTLKQSSSHTDAELDAIEAMITNVDWGDKTKLDHEALWERLDDGSPDFARTGDELNRMSFESSPPPPHYQPPNEGYTLDEATVDAIKKTVETLDKVTLTQVDQWSREAHAAHRPFSLSREDCRTQRRFEIMRAAIALSPYEPDVQRAALGFVMGSEVQTSVTLGAALGSLTIGEATRLALLAESLGTTVSVVYGLSGPQFDGPGLAAVA